MKVAILIPDNRDEFREYSDPEPRFGPAPTALLEGLASLPNCEIHIVCCTHRSLRSPSKIAGNIWYHSLVVPKWGWRLAYLGCVWAIRRKLHALHPDIVHGQGTERYCALSAALSGFRNVITIHGNMRAVSKALRAKPFSFHWLAGLLETVALVRTEGVVCLTSYTRHQVTRWARRTWLVPNAVDSTFFHVQREPALTPTIICAANADVYKNQAGLIRAMDNVARTRSITLLLAGKISPDDASGAEVLRLCSERPWCRHLGSLDRNGFQALLGRATLLILPSLEDNCPMVILEAMAAGVPVAASKIGGIPDLVESGVTGMLFDPTDAVSMRAAVENLLADPHAARRRAESAQELARIRFSPLVVAQRHLEIYHDLLVRNAGRPQGSRVD
jgi:glycosyltransferase involved in cell wall biosynthesis